MREEHDRCFGEDAGKKELIGGDKSNRQKKKKFLLLKGGEEFQEDSFP